jgi:hypothetical protein
MTMPGSDPELQALLDRQAIHDVLMRYSRGLDRHERKVLESVYWPDAVDDHITYRGDRAPSAARTSSWAVDIST